MERIGKKTLKSQVACYLSFNVVSLNDHGPRLDSIPLVTLSNFLLALRFYLLALVPPARRYQAQVAWLLAEIVVSVCVWAFADSVQKQWRFT